MSDDTTTTTKPSTFLEDAVRAAFTAKIRVSSQRTNRASQAGLACSRRLLWNRTRTLEQKPPDEGLMRIFERGNAVEATILRALEDGGLEVLQRQRDLEWRKYGITGRIDALVKDEAGVLGPLEVKSVSRYIFESVKKNPTLAAIVERDDHLARYPLQTGAYCLCGSWARGWLLFTCADTLRTVQVTVDPFDDCLAPKLDAWLDRLALVEKAVAEDKDLPPEPGPHCDRCPFLATCAPPRTWKLTTHVLDDADLILKIARLQELKAAHGEYEDLSEELKEKLPAIAGDYIAGPFVVHTKVGETTKYPLTAEDKKRLATKVPLVSRKYERLLPESKD